MKNAVLRGLEIIANYLEQEPRVKSITTINQDELDYLKKNNYPIANIRLNDVNIEDGQVTYEVIVLDQRDTNKKKVEDVKHWNDNRWDNWALSVDILRNLTLKLKLFRNDYDIQLVSITSPIIIDKDFANGLDGVSILITLQYYEQESVC